MKEKKIAFTCGWGQSSQALYDKYKLIAPARSGRWNCVTGVPNIDEADVVFMFDGFGNYGNSYSVDDLAVVERLKTKKLFAVRCEPPCIDSSPIRMHPALVDKITVVDFTTQPIWYFSKWWEMSKTYSHEDFLNMPNGEKTGKLSCLLSGKSRSSGHKKRLRLVNELVKTNPNLLTLYGRNHIPTNKRSLSHEEKFIAYKDFEYTLCFENCSIPNYFSDKIFDAMLMWSVPIYFGATNVSDYLPSDSFYALSEDLNEDDIEMVKNVCSRPPLEKNIKALGEARRLIFEKYSLWASLEYVLENY